MVQIENMDTFPTITINMSKFHGIDPYVILDTSPDTYNSLTNYELKYLHYIYSILKKWKYYEYEEIPRSVRELMEPVAINALKNRPLGEEVDEIMDKYTIQELKIIVKNNYGEVWGNKSYKKNWARALVYTKKYSFNVFAINSCKNDILNDDVLNIINQYL